MSDIDDDYLGDDDIEISSDVEELESRIQELEYKLEQLEPTGSNDAGLTVGYVLGMSISVVLSYERNHSILWCVLHGLLSWAYVAYHALSK